MSGRYTDLYIIYTHAKREKGLNAVREELNVEAKLQSVLKQETISHVL
jgi:hypothetical protein